MTIKALIVAGSRGPDCFDDFHEERLLSSVFFLPLHFEKLISTIDYESLETKEHDTVPEVYDVFAFCALEAARRNVIRTLY